MRSQYRLHKPVIKEGGKVKKEAITVVEDGEVLYMGFDNEEAWKIYTEATGRDVTYVNRLSGDCCKKNYISVANEWHEAIFRNNRAAYEYCKMYHLNGTYVKVVRFFRDQYWNTVFRPDIMWVKNFYIREDVGCFPNKKSEMCRINLDDTTSRH